jgi:hypothetical protein
VKASGQLIASLQLAEYEIVLGLTKDAQNY